MPERLSRRSRSLLSLTLTSMALALSILALCTSYWCEGTHKVVKPLCLSPVKMKNCGQNNSEPYTTESPTQNPFNRTLSPARREELAKIRQRQLANAVHYIWETGEDKFAFRYFHTGFWESCEKHSDGEKCRSFIELTPGETQGLLGMVAHMMYTTVFQMTVIVGPKDWRPQSWDYGWSFALAWVSFSCCMGAAVVTLNSYTKTIIELRRKQRLRLEEARAATHAPCYEEVVSGGGAGGFYSVSGLLHCPDGMMDVAWAPNGSVVGMGNRDVPTLVLVGGCGPEGCEDCEREMDEMDEMEVAVDRVDSPC
ncbi:germ cell-specific gene 1-like protein isoform X2 [Dunckerocampus dactyliophorus]|uniref:germ cell-specific gene 1-like protein isoform X2 n=1 Tax=Dunckerocampus dactyliophorus TaxID=161453 RepID=UPI002405B948|nr:germ cell-specific gene 1-like protein isoform X2 [Dunckerocampus dactyliophorus]